MYYGILEQQSFYIVFTRLLSESTHIVIIELILTVALIVVPAPSDAPECRQDTYYYYYLIN